MRIYGRVVSVTAVFSALLLLAPLSARAQFHMAGRAHPVMHSIRVRRSAIHGVAAGRARIATAAPRQFHPTRSFSAPAASFGNAFEGGSGETLQQLLDPVPGLGFDYSYLNAVNSDLAIKAVIDPETEWRLAVAERVARDTGGFASPGYYLLDGGGEYITPAEPATDQQPPQPTVIVLQEPAKQQVASETTPTVAPQPATPLPDVSNFTLVLQGGKKIQAIAFTRAGNQIVYITADGARHSIAATELDSGATQSINESSGTQLRF
ncbi:MAG: SPOR domain-containing protein [Candidatus Acidiferrales bacterium]